MKILGSGFLGLLALVFITLKLCGVINWAWWVVLAPIWAPFAVAGIVIIGLLLACLILGFKTDL